MSRKISIVIPALNEEEGIKQTLRSIPKSDLERIGYEVQILVVDNNSKDGTGEIAKQNGAIVVHEPKRGYGRALKTGFAHTTGDIIVTTDADGTHPTDDIPRLIKILEDENLDFITTSRFPIIDKNVMSFQNKVGNIILTLTTRILFFLNIKDSQSGMWTFKRNLLDEMSLKSNGMALSEEIKIEACYFIKCHWKEIPIPCKARVGKVKLMSWRDGFKNLLYLIKKRVNR